MKSILNQIIFLLSLMCVIGCGKPEYSNKNEETKVSTVFWKYYVLFDETPPTLDSLIYNKGIVIGKIGVKTLDSNQKVKILISIDNQYVNLMKENCTFAVRKNRLEYDSGELPLGKPLAEESTIKGFNKFFFNYYVLFDEAPSISDSLIYYEGISIGKKGGITLDTNRQVKVKIFIEEQYEHLMKENCTFVIREDRIDYDTIGKKLGNPIPKSSEIQGFVGDLAFTKFLGKKGFGKAVQSFQELLK